MQDLTKNIRLLERYFSSKEAELLLTTYAGAGSKLSNKILRKSLGKGSEYCNRVKAVLSDNSLVTGGTKTAPREWVDLDELALNSADKDLELTLNSGGENLEPALNSDLELDTFQENKEIESSKNNDLAFQKKEGSLNQESPLNPSEMMLRRMQKDQRQRMKLEMYLNKSPLFSDVIFSYLESSELKNDLYNSYKDVGLVFDTFTSSSVVDMDGISKNVHFKKTVLPMLESLGFITNEIHGSRWIDAQEVNSVISSMTKYCHVDAVEDIEAVEVSEVVVGFETDEELMKKAEEINAKLKGNIKKVAAFIPVASKWIKKKIGTTDDLVEAYQNNKKDAA